MDATALQLIIPIAGVVAVLFAIYLARDVLSRDTGTPEMVAVGDTIREGADAFVRRQFPERPEDTEPANAGIEHADGARIHRIKA